MDKKFSDSLYSSPSFILKCRADSRPASETDSSSRDFDYKSQHSSLKPNSSRSISSSNSLENFRSLRGSPIPGKTSENIIDKCLIGDIREDKSCCGHADIINMQNKVSLFVEFFRIDPDRSPYVINNLI